jgi:hypothetical protein
LRRRKVTFDCPWGNLDRTLYLVLDDFGGKYGWSWSETSVVDTDRAIMIRRLLEGQYSALVRIIVAFNTAEGIRRARRDGTRCYIADSDVSHRTLLMALAHADPAVIAKQCVKRAQPPKLTYDIGAAKSRTNKVPEIVEGAEFHFVGIVRTCAGGKA